MSESDQLAKLTAAFATWPASTKLKVGALLQQLDEGKITREQMAQQLTAMNLPGVRSVRPRPVQS